MSRPPFTVVRDSPAALAGHLRDWARDALRSRRGSLVGLAVGSSTLPLYGAIGDLDGPQRLRIVPIDELVPEPADPNKSFFARLRAALPAGLAARVEPLPVDPSHLDALVAQSGLRALVLGLGTDGHIAFNQPGSSPDSASAVVQLTPDNLARLGDVAPAKRALTMGIATVLSADRIALVASGEGKSSVLRRVLEGPEASDVPATWLRTHDAVTILMDDTL